VASPALSRASTRNCSNCIDAFWYSKGGGISVCGVNWTSRVRNPELAYLESTGTIPSPVSPTTVGPASPRRVAARDDRGRLNLPAWARTRTRSKAHLASRASPDFRR
jgi:hypothetical protein